jgi:hypothetical protein
MDFTVSFKQWAWLISWGFQILCIRIMYDTSLLTES